MRRGHASGSEPSFPSGRASELASLVEKIELFVRAQRPALALRLGASGCCVELELRGPGAVVVTLLAGTDGTRAPIDPRALGRALEERGLRLAELRVSHR